MKKTLTLCALAVLGLSTAFAEVDFSTKVSDWNGAVATSGVTALTDFGSAAGDGITIVMNLTDWTVKNGPIFYLTTAETPGGNQYGSMALGVGWANSQKATLYNTSGSSNTVSFESNVTGLGLPSVNISANTVITTTLIATVDSTGTAKLYEVASGTGGDGNAHLICSVTGMKTDPITGIITGNWAGSGSGAVAQGLTLGTYDGVATLDEINAFVNPQTPDPDPNPGTADIPEPASATLSLLALAGLCARRRRK